MYSVLVKWPGVQFYFVGVSYPKRFIVFSYEVLGLEVLATKFVTCWIRALERLLAHMQQVCQF